VDQAVYDLRNKFSESLDDDFNTSAALAALFQFIRRLNIIMDKSGLSSSGKKKVIKALESIDSVLGVMALGPEEMGSEGERLDCTERKGTRRQGLGHSR